MLRRILTRFGRCRFCLRRADHWMSYPAGNVNYQTCRAHLFKRPPEWTDARDDFHNWRDR